MDGQYVMGLDEGTGSARTVILDEEGRIVSEAALELKQYNARAGWSEQDPVEIFETQLETMRRALAEAKLSPQDIRAIGVTDQRSVAVVWEKDTGKPIYNAIAWFARDQVNDIVERWAAEGLNTSIRDKTGLPNDSWFCASKIAWILENVEGARERAERGELLAGTIDAWLIWNLTGGERFVTDYSNASHTMFFNIHTLQWDEELCDALGIPVRMLPEVVPSDSHFGTTGGTFDSEIPIRAVLGDQMAGLFGQTCYKPGLAKNTYGTAGVYNVNTGSEPAYREGLLTSIAWGLDGEVTYETEAVFFSGGATIQWLRDAMKMIDTAPESEWYSSQVPDTQGVYLVPAFNGLVSPHYDMYARAVICGMSNSTNRNHVIRAGLESIAYQTRDLVEAVTGQGDLDVYELRVDGGAAKNDLLCQFQADILGMPVIRPKITEATVLGISYMAGLAGKLWKNQDELSDMWQKDRVFEPRMKDDRRERLYEGWKAAIDLTRGWAKKVNLD